MAENTEQGRSEKPTPFKQREARRKGTVLKSADVLAFAALAGFVAGALLHLGQIAVEFVFAVRHLYGGIGTLDGDLLAATSGLTRHFFKALIPIAGLIIIAVIGASLLQSGPVFSFEPVKPDFKRLNPKEGFKKLFSKRIFTELAKTVIKVLLFVLVCGAVFWGLVGDMTNTGVLTLKALFGLAHWYGIRLISAVLGLMLVFSGLDFWLSRRRYNQQMMMSRREIREEHKRQEGDPMIRRRQREIRRELAKKTNSLSAVKDADFILTNPQHLAIAIRYQPQVLDAPVVVAKGAGHMAKRIRDIARQHHVPQIERKPLARRIYFHTRIGQPVDPKHYTEVARLMQRAGLFAAHYKR